VTAWPKAALCISPLANYDMGAKWLKRRTVGHDMCKGTFESSVCVDQVPRRAALVGG
jgi:hypothetical protein